MTQEHSDSQANAVIRLDEFNSTKLERREIQEIITVKSIHISQQHAETEVERLNELNSDEGCFYFWQATRLNTSLKN